MFGTIRFISSILVAISHLNFFFWGYNEGVFAVILFYILAGYIMTYFMSNIFTFSLKGLKSFYLDRFLRIYPLYLVVLIISIIFLIISPIQYVPLTFKVVAANLLLIPLNYFMQIPTNITPKTSILIIPPTWSLGAEIQYYIFAPFLIHFKKLRLLIYISSIIFFTIASFAYVDTDTFGYRLLPGILFIFILGTYIYESKQQLKFPIRVLQLTWLYFFALIIILNQYDHLHAPYNVEVITAILFGIPIIKVLGNIKTRYKIDDELGNLTYGIFLLHYLFIWIFQTYFKGISYEVHITATVIASIISSWILHKLLERPLSKLRKSFRGK